MAVRTHRSTPPDEPPERHFDERSSNRRCPSFPCNAT